MAGSFIYTVILDACVLYPAHMRDLLLTLAEDGVCRARWTDKIHDEWVRSVLKNRPDLTADKLQRTVDLMNASVEDCLVDDYEYLIESLHLPDPDDRHVLAAAIVGHADAIITFNLKDFPDEITQKHNVAILHPDDFLIAQYDLSPIRFLTLVKELRARLVNPALSPEELIAKYLAHGLPQLCQRLTAAVHLI